MPKLKKDKQVEAIDRQRIRNARTNEQQISALAIRPVTRRRKPQDSRACS